MTPRYAGLVSRTGAVLTDVVVLAVLIAVTQWVIQQIGRQILAWSFLDPGDCSRGTEWWRFRTWLCRGLPWVGPVAAFSFPVIYRVAFWTVTGQTPGMALFGLRVLRADGRPVRLGVALRRILGYVACIFTFGIGFLMVAASRQRRGLHDRIAGTVEVHDWLDPARSLSAVATPGAASPQG